MQNIVVEYFSTLFKSTSADRRLSENEKVAGVSEEQNENLLLPIIKEEVKDAVFAMNPDKSLGLDGLNPAFF